jgi:hypothetical protein
MNDTIARGGGVSVGNHQFVRAGSLSRGVEGPMDPASLHARDGHSHDESGLRGSHRAEGCGWLSQRDGIGKRGGDVMTSPRPFKAQERHLSSLQRMRSPAGDPRQKVS